MKMLNTTFAIIITMLIFISCSNSESTSSNVDPELVGKWVRNGKYHLHLYNNGIGSKTRDVEVTEDVKKFKKSRINWASFNNNFLLVSMDKKVIGMSYQVIGDTLFIREPKDDLEYFLRVKE